jgi:hypothetical protein
MRCKECSEEIPNWVILDGKRVNLSSRRYCLRCSPYGERARNRAIGDLKRCPRCTRRLPPSGFYLRRKREGLGNLSAWCRRCYREDTGERNRAFKKKCVEYKGGVCQRCEYSKYIGALEFHHRDPTQKDFGIGTKKSCVWTEEVRQELDKCDLLCSNCHKEVHGELGLDLLA